MRRLTLASASLLLLGCAHSPADAPEVDLLIRADRVIIGSGEVLGETWLAVVDGRIDQMSAVPLEVSADVVLDLAPDRTLMPGLIETHAHLLAHPDFTKDSDGAMVRFLEATLSEILDDYLAAGFTTIVDNGDPWPDVREVRDQITDGVRRGPRMLTLGPVLTGPNGHPAGNIYGTNTWGRERGTRELDSPAEAREVVNRLVQEGVDGIKVAYDGNPQPRMDRGVLTAIVTEAETRGIPVYVHAGTAEEARTAVEIGAARLVHVPTESEVAGSGLTELLIGRGIGVATTLGASGPRGHFSVSSGTEDPSYATTRKNLKTFAEAGVMLAYGTDNTNVFAASRVLEVELEALEGAAMTRSEIVASLTLNAARYLFREGDLGTIEPGKVADLIVVGGNPLEDLSMLLSVSHVVQAGEVVINRKTDSGGKDPR